MILTQGLEYWTVVKRMRQEAGSPMQPGVGLRNLKRLAQTPDVSPAVLARIERLDPRIVK